jgi:molybdenum cofactor guanylyltransferase
MQRVGGIVLCGGQSTRMGQPKCWLPFADEILLPRIVRLLSEVVSPIIVVASAGQDLPPLASDIIRVHDPIPDLGPLQGLAAGLAALPERTDSAFVTSCDVPLLRPTFVQRIIDLLGESQACVPRIHGFYHPLAGVYRREVGRAAEQLLATGRRAVTDLFTVLRTRIVTADELADVDPDLQALRNVNTPQDYAAALRDA